MATAAQVLGVLNNPGIWQRFVMRREIRAHINDSEMEGVLFKPLVTEMLAMGEKCTEADAQAMINRDYAAKVKAVASALVQRHHLSAADFGPGANPFIDFLMQLFQQLLPMLLACLGG